MEYNFSWQPCGVKTSFLRSESIFQHMKIVVYDHGQGGKQWLVLCECYGRGRGLGGRGGVDVECFAG